MEGRDARAWGERKRNAEHLQRNAHAATHTTHHTSDIIRFFIPLFTPHPSVYNPPVEEEEEEEEGWWCLSFSIPFRLSNPPSLCRRFMAAYPARIIALILERVVGWVGGLVVVGGWVVFLGGGEVEGKQAVGRMRWWAHMGGWVGG